MTAAVLVVTPMCAPARFLREHRTFTVQTYAGMNYHERQWPLTPDWT